MLRVNVTSGVMGQGWWGEMLSCLIPPGPDPAGIVPVTVTGLRQVEKRKPLLTTVISQL